MSSFYSKYISSKPKSCLSGFKNGQIQINLPRIDGFFFSNLIINRNYYLYGNPTYTFNFNSENDRNKFSEYLEEINNPNAPAVTGRDVGYIPSAEEMLAARSSNYSGGFANNLSITLDYNTIVNLCKSGVVFKPVGTFVSNPSVITPYHDNYMSAATSNVGNIGSFLLSKRKGGKMKKSRRRHSKKIKSKTKRRIRR